MEYEMLKTAAENITMSENMKRRIVNSCKEQILNQTEECVIKTRNNKSIFRKPAAVFAVLVLCIALTVTAIASTGTQQGFFRDIKNARGAVTGTAYENATDEISLSVSVSGENLNALAAFTDPQKAPFAYTETLKIAEYRIIDVAGAVIKEGSDTAAFKITDGQANIEIPVNDLASGDYRLIVTAFTSEKKAEQPLNISGHWECTFTK